METAAPPPGDTAPRPDEVMVERPLRRTSVTRALAVLLTLGSVAWALDLYRSLGMLFYAEQFLAGMLAVALPLVFLAAPARRRDRTRTPAFDYVLAALGCGVAVYMALAYPDLSMLTTARPLNGLVAGGLLLVLVLEAVRRTVGLAIVVVAIGFIVAALLGRYFPGSLQGRPLSVGQLTYYLAWDNSGLIGLPLRIVVTVVVAFVLFGNLLFRTGGGAFFTDLALGMMGRYRGGAAKIGILASSLFGSISGSVVSNVVTTGVVTIPLMKKSGLTREQAGAIEAVASTGGQLMPPIMGAAAFLMAEFLGIPYKDVALAALIPALMFYLALFLQADLEAARQGIRAVDPELIPRIGIVLRGGWFFLVPFVVLIGAMFWLNYIPERSAVIAAGTVVLGGLFFTYGTQRLTWRTVLGAIEETGYTALDIVMIGAAAGIVIGALNLSGLGFGLTMNLASIAAHQLPLLLIIAAVLSIVLGMGMPTVGVYVLLATLIVPALVEAGIDPLAAHMFVLYFGMMSMITPPIAIGAFAAAAIAGGNAMRTGWEAVRFGWLAFVIPFLFVLSPAFLLRGDPWVIALSLVTGLVGICCVSAAIVGYFVGPLRPAVRVAAGVAGLALLLPVHSVQTAWINGLGAVLAAALLALELRGERHVRVARLTAGRNQMLIDIYCHIYPERYFQEMLAVSPKLGNIGKRLRSVTQLFDLDARFREMDRFGDYRQVISLSNPPLEDIADAATGARLARIANDAMAELCHAHPQRFPAFVAAVSLLDVEAAVAEAERAIVEAGARGVQVYTNIAGRPLDDPAFAPIFALAAAHDLPVWLHPARTAVMPDYAAEERSRYEMWWCFGWPYETTVAMSRMVFSGLFDRYPGLKVITHHLGGMIPYYDGRIGPGMEMLGSRTSDEDYSGVLPALKRPHMDYFREFYADTALFGGSNGLQCGIDFFGTDRVLFASDTPLGPVAPTIAALEAADLTAEARGKIASGNAARLLNMAIA